MKSSERWQEVKEILYPALEMAAAKRSSYLDEKCGNDHELRQEVESLIAAHGQAGARFESRAMEAIVADVVNDGTNAMAGRSLGHYEVIEEIGAGGMGEVYLARDTLLNRKVALKFLPPYFTQDKERVRRFQQEARAASALNHPNILTVYEIRQLDSSNYIATEFIEGETLRERLGRSAPNITDALDAATQVAAALTAAHEAGIVHRDIKPENIMLRRDGIVKVLDFGLAKLTERPATDSEASTMVHTDEGIVMGTAQYMSPEQARGLQVDARTDIWSLGCVLYEMLAGRSPFEAPTAGDVIVSILEREPPPLTRFAPEIPSELDWIVKKALRKEREERYQTGKELLSDLRDLRHRLEFEAEAERSGPPPLKVTTASTAVRESTEPIAAETIGQHSGHPTSSAEYLVTEFSRYQGKLLSIVGVAILLLVGGFFAHQYFSPTNQIESIAVMPFVNDSGNADVEYLSDGMTETLIRSLSQLPNLAVKSRSVVFFYKGKDTSPKKIGEELGVPAVLLGRVGGRGDDLTLSLELVDTQTQDVIWAEQYDRKQSDLVSLQSEIAKDVSGKLKSRLSGADEAKVTKTSTADPQAYQAYLKGRYYWNRRTAENLTKAMEEFKAATDRDPNYALAYAGLADCFVVLNQYAGTPTRESLPQARIYAERAIAIDAELAEPYATLGMVGRHLWSWAGSERDFKRAIELNPNYATAYHWYSLLLKDLGRFEESAVMIKRAKELDPLSSVINVNISMMYQGQNDYQASAENLLKIIEIDPSFASAYDQLGISYLKLGRETEGIANMEKAVELSNRSSLFLTNLGYAYAVTGKRTEGTAVLKELAERYARKEANGMYVAAVYAGLGDKNKAFEWLEKAFQTREDLGGIRWRIHYETLRDDPRYKDLLKRMNLPS